MQVPDEREGLLVYHLVGGPKTGEWMVRELRDHRLWVFRYHDGSVGSMVTGPGLAEESEFSSYVPESDAEVLGCYEFAAADEAFSWFEGALPRKRPTDG